MRVGRRRVLLADVRHSADGDGVGYGTMLKRMHRVLRFGQVTDASVLFVRPARSINTAVFYLRSDEVDIVSPSEWRAFWLKCVWFATAAFRLGSPWLWTQRLAKQALLEHFRAAVERSRYVPRAVRRFVLRPRALYRRLKAANNAYASLSAASWRRTFKYHAGKRLRDAKRTGTLPLLRLTLPAGRERAAIEQASALGITSTAPLVTVHVRESGYRSAAGLHQRSWDVIRNARIETYLDAFGALVERGYTVVRLGDRTMTPVRRPGVVDLATSPASTEWLEIWCALRSQFLIGCDSGPSWLAVLLGVPVLTVNAVHFGDASRPSDRFIYKLPRDRATGKVLSLWEMLTEDYLRVGLEADKYDYLDNTPSDICDAIIDMIDVVGGRESLSPAQRRFNERLVECRRDHPSGWTSLDGIAFTGRPQGTVSRSFAEQYLAAPAHSSSGPAVPAP